MENKCVSGRTVYCGFLFFFMSPLISPLVRNTINVAPPTSPRNISSIVSSTLARAFVSKKKSNVNWPDSQMTAAGEVNGYIKTLRESTFSAGRIFLSWK